jgi:hypothetical protein
LGGSVLLSVSAFLAGALPSGDPGAGFRNGGFGAVPGRFTFGLCCWLVGAFVLCLAWLRSPASTLRQTLVTGALWALPFVVAPPLGSRDVYAYACQGWVWWYGGDPYASGVVDGGCPWAASVPTLWWHTPTPYGPLAVLLSGLATAFGSQVAALVVLRLLALLAAALLAYQLPRLAARSLPSALATPKTSAPEAHAVALRLGLVTPLVLLHGISGAHNDLIVAALLVSALTLAATPQNTLSTGGEARQAGRALWLAAGVGLLLAASVGIKATALVAVPFALILTGRRWWVTGLSAAGGFAALSAVTGLGLGWIPALRNTGELAQWSSPPTAVGMAVGYLTGSSAAPIAVARVIGLIALAAFVGWQLARAWLQRGETRAVIVTCGLSLAATVLLGPIFYPWYAIVPIAVLAAVTRAWLAPATIVCTFLVLPNGLGVPVLTKAAGAFAVTAALIALLARWIRRRRPAPAA